MRRYLAVVLTLLLTTRSVAQTATTPPAPLTPVAQWFSGDSYPAASTRAGEEGDVSALLSVDAQGMVSDCRITQSSGHPLLDQATCRLAARRARFAPAKDTQGRSVAGSYAIDRLKWRIKGVEAPVAPPPDGTTLTPATSPATTVVTGTATRAVTQEAATFLQSLSGPPLPATLPVTPRRSQIAAPLWNALALEEGIRAVATVQYQQLLAQVTAGTASLPTAMQERAKSEFRAAYDTALRRYIAEQRDHMVRYAAARLDDQEIGIILSFLASGIGYKMVHEAAGMTASDRQEVGRAELDHPALAKLVKVQSDYAKATIADRATVTRAFYADVHGGFCQSIAGERFTFASCPARKR